MSTGQHRGPCHPVAPRSLRPKGRAPPWYHHAFGEARGRYGTKPFKLQHSAETLEGIPREEPSCGPQVGLQRLQPRPPRAGTGKTCAPVISGQKKKTLLRHFKDNLDK